MIQTVTPLLTIVWFKLSTCNIEDDVSVAATKVNTEWFCILEILEYEFIYKYKVQLYIRQNSRG